MKNVKIRVLSTKVRLSLYATNHNSIDYFYTTELPSKRSGGSKNSNSSKEIPKTPTTRRRATDKDPKKLNNSALKNTVSHKAASSPLVSQKKKKQQMLDEKLRKLKETTLKDYQRSKQNSTRNNLHSEFQKYASVCKTPINAAKNPQGPAMDTSPQGKKLIKTRFKENLQRKESGKKPIVVSPSKKHKIDSVRNKLKSRNKEEISH